MNTTELISLGDVYTAKQAEADEEITVNSRAHDHFF